MVPILDERDFLFRVGGLAATITNERSESVIVATLLSGLDLRGTAP